MAHVVSKNLGPRVFDLKGLGEGVSVTLVLYPHDDLKLERGVIDYVSVEKAIFMYSVQNWSGIVDEDGNLLECNEDNKLFIFRYDSILREAINEAIKDLQTQKDKRIKN